MKVHLRMMVDDPNHARLDPRDQVEGFEPKREEFYLDGPVSKRVAVLDFNAETGKLEPGAVFLPPDAKHIMGRYDVPKYPEDLTLRSFNQLSAFATVLETIYMYEEEDTLGRDVTWAFGAPQLLVVPRAGEDENAYYERDSHSLQFFYFPSHENPEQIIYTSLARDVVAHETGHAILDGIAPHLWDAITPQSLALHEAIGDLTAVLASLRSNKLVEAVLKERNGSIEESTAFSAIAEQFGMARGSGALRSLYDADNKTKMSSIDRGEPHALSVVLTAALYTVLVKMHQARKAAEVAATGKSDFSVSGKALALVAGQFKRMTMRALDYLPPGEVSFADYGRAIIAADQASHPTDPQERDWIMDEFYEREVVPSRDDLKVTAPQDDLSGLDLPAIAESDWAAYDFANSERGHRMLGIPPATPFHVEPRLAVSKTYYHRPGSLQPAEERVREILFKVWWRQEEDNVLFLGFPTKREITVGTTLSWDQETRKPRVLLTSKHGPAEQAEQQADRDRLLRSLMGRGLLNPGLATLDPDSSRMRGAVDAQIKDGRLRLAGAARALHLLALHPFKEED